MKNGGLNDYRNNYWDDIDEEEEELKELAELAAERTWDFNPEPEEIKDDPEPPPHTPTREEK